MKELILKLNYQLKNKKSISKWRKKNKKVLVTKLCEIRIPTFSRNQAKGEKKIKTKLIPTFCYLLQLWIFIVI